MNGTQQEHKMVTEYVGSYFALFMNQACQAKERLEADTDRKNAAHYYANTRQHVRHTIINAGVLDLERPISIMCIVAIA